MEKAMNQHSKKHKTKISLGVIGGILLIACFLLAENGARIKFNEESWDLGRVKQGKILTHVFVFQNVGDAPLVIKKVYTSCGCTAALVSNKNIAPGKRGEIKATFNTQGYEGDVSKYVYVESNDSEQPRVQLTVSASIDVPPRPKIDLDHYSVDLGLILETEPIQTQARIRNKGELELQVELSHRDASFFLGKKKITFPVKIASRKEVVIGIKISPQKRKGMIREYILLKSNDPMRPNLSLYISGYIVTKEQLKELFKKYKDIL